MTIAHGAVCLRWGITLPSWNRVFANAGRRLAALPGVARIAERTVGGAGVILKFEHVRPRKPGSFQPLRSDEVRPGFLDKAIGAMRRWGYDFVSMDEMKVRALQPASARRFVCLSFDCATSDFMTFAYPVLSRHRVPFTLYVPTGFIDGIGEAWWLALEEIVAHNERIGLMVDNVENRFAIGTTEEKYQVYDFLYDWMRALPPPDRSAAIGDLCTRYGADLKALSRGDAMTWANLTTLARDAQATIGSATVHYPQLSSAAGNIALREMTMGRSILETALGTECRHFAYPFGHGSSFGPREIQLAQQAGFLTAVSAQPGVVQPQGKSEMLSLPRIVWNGRHKSLSHLRAAMAGFILPRDRAA